MDRRKQNRSHLIHYLILYSQDTGHAIGNLVNINPEGIKFISPEKIEPNTPLKLRMSIPEELSSKDEILFEGETLWCEKDINPDLFAIGMEISLISPDDIDTILRLIEEYDEADE